MLQRLKYGISDRLGGLLALICAIHCAVLPVIASLGSVFAHGVFDVAFLISAIGLTTYSAYSAQKSNTLKLRILVMFSLGIFLLILSLIFHLHVISALGGIILAISHYLNFKHKKASNICLH